MFGRKSRWEQPHSRVSNINVGIVQHIHLLFTQWQEAACFGLDHGIKSMDSMYSRNIEITFFQNRFQSFFDALLAMKYDNVGNVFIGRQCLSRGQVFGRQF